MKKLGIAASSVAPPRPNILLSAMLAAKCRDQNIMATKERQQRFAEYVGSPTEGSEKCSRAVQFCRVGCVVFSFFPSKLSVVLIS